MTIATTRKKYIWILVALIILAATMGLMYFVNNVNNDGIPIASKNSANTQLGVETIATTESLKSSNELQDFLNEQENEPAPFTTVGNVNKEDIDWDSQELVVVEFYIPSGQSVKELSVSDQGEITASILKAPQGCTFSAVQVKQIQFVPVTSGQQTKQNVVYLQYIDNPESCNQEL